MEPSKMGIEFVLNFMNEASIGGNYGTIPPCFASKTKPEARPLKRPSGLETPE
jgi:hypothetical protein